MIVMYSSFYCCHFRALPYKMLLIQSHVHIRIKQNCRTLQTRLIFPSENVSAKYSKWKSRPIRRGHQQQRADGSTNQIRAAVQLNQSDSLATDTHTQPFNGPWSGTTRVGRYQKKHSPTHTHPDHRTSFINFLHLLRYIASPVFSLRAWQSSLTTSLQVLFGHWPLSAQPIRWSTWARLRRWISRWRAQSRGRQCERHGRWGCWWCLQAARDWRRSGQSWCPTCRRSAAECSAPSQRTPHLTNTRTHRRTSLTHTACLKHTHSHRRRDLNDLIDWLSCVFMSPPHTHRLMALFQEYLGKPVPES